MQLDANACLIRFVERAVIAARRERYAGFATRPSTRRKFLDALDHDMAHVMDVGRRVEKLESVEWNEAGYLFASNGTWGEGVATLRQGYEQASPYGGWLLLSSSGRIAVLRPEGRQDDERFYRC